MGFACGGRFSLFFTTNKHKSLSKPLSFNLEWSFNTSSSVDRRAASFAVDSSFKFNFSHRDKTLLNSPKFGFEGRPIYGPSPTSIIFIVSSREKLPFNIFFHSIQILSPDILSMPPTLSFSLLVREKNCHLIFSSTPSKSSLRIFCPCLQH